MAIELFWDNDEQTVMLMVFEKGWAWEELFETLNTVKQVTAKRDDPIGAILDLRNGFSIPGGSIFSFEARNQAQKMLEMSDGSKGPMAIVGAGPALKTLIQAFKMIDKNALNDVFFVDTMTEAQQIMEQFLTPPMQKVLA